MACKDYFYGLILLSGPCIFLNIVLLLKAKHSLAGQTKSYIGIGLYIGFITRFYLIHEIENTLLAISQIAITAGVLYTY